MLGTRVNSHLKLGILNVLRNACWQTTDFSKAELGTGCEFSTPALWQIVRQSFLGLQQLSKILTFLISMIFVNSTPIDSLLSV